MYVCNCHGFNEKAVKRAIRQGMQTVSAIYRCLDHTPQCGKCVPDIVRMLKEHRATELASSALAEAAD